VARVFVGVLRELLMLRRDYLITNFHRDGGVPVVDNPLLLIFCSPPQTTPFGRGWAP
jgi:hypothetical protein